MKAYQLEGSSMLPVFRPGEAALVAPERPGPGDCAVYDYRGRTLLHRAVSVSAAGAVFADDAGRLEPHFVPWPGVKGKALGRRPFSGGLPGLLYCRLRRALARPFLRR